MTPLERWARIQARIKYFIVPNMFRVSTWLALGSLLQILSLVFLPLRLSGLAPILLLLQRFVKAARESRQIYTKVFKDVRLGRWTAVIPSKRADQKEAGVVMFVLGARVNHPQGRLPANGRQLGNLYDDMWQEAETNRVKWGYLGRTPMLMSTNDEKGFTMIWLSYWRDIQGLHQFSKSTAHITGQKAYQGDNKFPHIGIMHELYYARKDSTETLYNNFPPFGLGATKLIVDGEDGPTLEDPLIPDAKNWSTMFERMKRERESPDEI